MLILFAYVRGGLGPEEFEQIASWTVVGQVPFILVADFNVDALDPDLVWWCDSLGAVARTTDGHTCFNSVGSPSKIDFTIFSRCLVKSFVGISACHGVSFRPHVAIKAKFVLDLRAVQVRKLLVLKKLPVVAADPFTRDEWEEATAIASNHVHVSRFFSPDMRVCLATASAVGTGLPSLEAGLLLWQWGRTLETATLLRAGIDPCAKDSRGYFGRGAPPTFAFKQAAPSYKPPCSAFPAPAGYSRRLALAEALCGAADRLSKLQKTSEKINTRYVSEFVL